MKIAIVGAMDYPNMDKVFAFIKTLPENATIITDGTIKFGKLVDDAARDLGMKRDIIRAVSPVTLARVKQLETICRTANEVYVFWDGKCQYARHAMIEAKLKNKLAKVYRPSGQ